MTRWSWSTATVLIALALLLSGVVGSAFPAGAQDTLEPTVEALSTQVAGLQTAVAILEHSATGVPSTPAPTNGESRTGDPVSENTGDGTSLAVPLPLGASAQVGDYDIRMVAVDNDAEAVMLAASSNNEPARSGERMIMATIEFTFDGAESGSPFWDLTYKAIGPRGLGVTDNDDDFECGTEPNSLFSAPEMFPGSTYAADVCWQFPEEEADSLVIEIAPLFDMNDEARYFALN